jgi:hypothetical protein
MLHVPSERKECLKFALDLIEKCRVSSGMRAAYARLIHAMTETGRNDSTRSLINKLHAHTERTAAHLFSPIDLRFTIDYENYYPQHFLERAKVAAGVLTRDWERNNTDMVFGQGVYEATQYGACLLKQWVQMEGTGDHEHPVYHKRLVMPWQFGVYREDENELGKQPAVCETTLLSLPEVWRRICHLPDRDALYKRIKTHAAPGDGAETNSFFHHVLNTSQINTGVQSATRPLPGGIVQLNNDPNYAIVGPEIGVDLVKFHELWVQDDTDYTTVQVIEPDILVAPRFKKANLLIPGASESGLQPYSLIQPNAQQGYFWGRPEIVDLIEPQMFLGTTADDVKRLFGLQVDKILGFVGFDGLTDEVYDERRAAGFFQGPPGSDIKDITPKFPEQALPLIDKLIEVMDTLGGFPRVMQGQGEPGVRAGTHANTLLKTGSPTLRDRSLLVERQCASAADLRLSLMEAKDGRHYWIDGSDLKKIEETKFLLHDLPDDRRVSVDSHSSSPIFADDHQQLVAFGVKAGFIDGHAAIDMLPYPQKELLHAKLREKEARQAQMIQEHPELLQQKKPGRPPGR